MNIRGHDTVQATHGLLTEGQYPAVRMRRLRAAPWIRDLTAEHRLEVHDLIWPVFVHDEEEDHPIASMPGVQRLSLPSLVHAARKAAALGIPALMLFPVVAVEHKTADGREACNPDNLLCRAVRALKDAYVDIGLICDVALDPYTLHGHDGIVQNGTVLNDATVEILCRQALTLAQAGCDVVAPSDMMDGRIGTIRNALDSDGFSDTLILSYAAKYASAFYGPFRDAVGSAQRGGPIDKRSYQMDPANAREALREVALDVAEGADMVMVKPGLPYLDVVQRVAARTSVPVLAYQVSGEYAMIRAAAAQGWLDAQGAIQESLLACKRAGARAIVTYAALEVAQARQR